MKTPLQKQTNILAAIVFTLAIAITTILCIFIPIGW